MRFRFYLFFCLLLPAVALAQTGSVTGKVNSADLQMPLAKASVFLSNATYGTATGDDGGFVLSGVKPGQYELVVSYVGYDSYHQTILVSPDKPITLKIEMHLHNTGLEGVTIVAHKYSKENFDMFVKYFLGESANAKQCKILNPKIIDLNYKKYDKVLEGHSDDFIVIENRALGYRLKYLLSDFKFDGINEIITIGGQPVYEDLKGSKSQLIKWHKKREEAYYGSSMHFYRSLINNDLDKQGFIVHNLQRIPNPERPPQFLIVKKIDQYEAIYNGNKEARTQRLVDSINYWHKMYQLRKNTEHVGKLNLTPQDLIGQTDDPGIYGITFPGYLYVIYTKKHDEVNDPTLYRPLDMENFMVTIITLYTKYAFFDKNGVVISGKSTLYEGGWARNKIPELLPVDYAPDDKKEQIK